MLSLVFALALANSPAPRPEAKPAPDMASPVSSPTPKPDIKTLLIHGKEYRVYVLDCDSPLDKALETYLDEALRLRGTRSSKDASALSFKTYLD